MTAQVVQVGEVAPAVISPLSLEDSERSDGAACEPCDIARFKCSLQGDVHQRIAQSDTVRLRIVGSASKEVGGVMSVAEALIVAARLSAKFGVVGVRRAMGRRRSAAS